MQRKGLKSARSDEVAHEEAVHEESEEESVCHELDVSETELSSGSPDAVMR